ncbi:hypothetical protein BY458DRAFT_534695 [Sporodiniella umbellata]|nr:hypothetical protein BY458DRAFT_534695 [Sporodiniella umbellata]
MTHQDLQQILYPQLSPSTFDLPNTDEGIDDMDELNEAPVAPAITETTIRVSRPHPPTDFVLSRSLTSEKELFDLAFRPAALNTRVTCRIQRCRDGLDKLYPQYRLSVEHIATGEEQIVMVARKKRKSNTSYYTITGVYRENELGPVQEVELGKVR